MLIIIAIMLILMLIGAVAIVIYNGLIYKNNQVESVSSTVDILLKKRYDLIPNLVNVVKAYAKHEKDIFEKIINLRLKAISEQKLNIEVMSINNQISKQIDCIMAISENYPELKASKNFLHLQKTLCEIEEQISAGRRAYNAAVTDYNNAIQMFPSSIIADLARYTPKDLFQIEQSNKDNIEVKFNI